MIERKHSKVRRTSVSQTLLLVSILIFSLFGVSKTTDDEIEQSFAELQDQQRQQLLKESLSSNLIEKHGRKVLNIVKGFFWTF